jgi:hypothetical protein
MVGIIQKKLKEKIRRSEECDDVKILNRNCKLDSNTRVEKYNLHTRGRLVWTIYIPARNRSPFKYHCDHLDASLYAKIA